MADRDLILLSGGLDSSTLLAQQVAEGTATLAVSISYGQRHRRRELGAATAIAARYGIEHLTLDLAEWGRLLTGSALTDPAVAIPHGHYADDSMRITVVPNRNAVLLMAAASVAEARRCTRVLIAVHAGDHPIYPDCRPEFIEAANRAVRLSTEESVCIAAPFVHLTKADITGRARSLGVPIGMTWSCYEGGELHCGHCGTCVERREALGVSDPTCYAMD